MDKVFLLWVGYFEQGKLFDVVDWFGSLEGVFDVCFFKDQIFVQDLFFYFDWRFVI